MDAAARWFCPILVKKLYSEAAATDIKLPEPIYGPIEGECGDSSANLAPSGIFHRLKAFCGSLSIFLGLSSGIEAVFSRLPSCWSIKSRSVRSKGTAAPSNHIRRLQDTSLVSSML